MLDTLMQIERYHQTADNGTEYATLLWTAFKTKSMTGFREHGNAPSGFISGLNLLNTSIITYFSKRTVIHEVSYIIDNSAFKS